MKTIKHIIFTAIVGSSTIASANGFYINEHDAKATGRGGATTATNTDPSSIVFNPGGIAIAEGTNFSIGGSLIVAKGFYEPAGGGAKTETDSSPAVVPSVYVTSKVHDLVAVGIGMHFPFGLAISWPTGHVQSDVIQDQTLRGYFITPSVGVDLRKFVPGLSVGGGIDIVPATVELSQTITFGDTQGTAHLGGDALGVGARLGVMYHPPAQQKLKFGAMWRSDVKLDFSGKGDFDIDPQFRSQLPPDGDIKTSITMPQSIWAGIAVQPNSALQVELDTVWMNWSKFKEIRIELPGGFETVSPQDYENTFTFRLGAEYKLESLAAAVRAGLVYDPSPIPSTTLTARLPETDHKNVTLGATKMFGDYAAHLGLLWVTPGERDTSNAMYMPAYKGTYGIQAFSASLQLSGHFGK